MTPTELISDFNKQIEDCQKNVRSLDIALSRERQKLLKLEGAVEGLSMLEDPITTKGSAVEPFNPESSPYHQPVEQPTTESSENG